MKCFLLRGILAAALWSAQWDACGAGDAPAPEPLHPDLPPSHSVAPELYATGFAFAEGPVFNKAGDLFVANYRRLGTIGRIKSDAAAGIFCDLIELAPVEGRPPQANGMKLDSQQRLIAADSGAGRLLRISADGKAVEVLADRWQGKRFTSVNDVALDVAGNIYFTDPGGSSVRNPVGAVYRYDVQTTKATQLAGDLAFPNGLAVAPDQKHLCVGEGQRYRVWLYDITKEGGLANPRVLVNFPTETRGEIVGGLTSPDGMVFDDKGRLYVAMGTGGVIDVVELPSGRLIRQYDAGGGQATNCHFWKGCLYTTVAAKEAVFRLKLSVEGFNYTGSTETSVGGPQGL